MTSPITPDSSKPFSGSSSSYEKPEGSSAANTDSTAKKANKVQSEIDKSKTKYKLGLTDNDVSMGVDSNEEKISLDEVEDKRKKRKIGNQKIKEISAKKPGEKKPANISLTNWETLSKATDKAKEIFWPQSHWKKALWSPVSIVASAGLALAHGAKTITHGVKYLKGNISKDSKLPPFLHNINPFRAQDFVELTEDEKDKFCKQMDRAWKKYQEIYNKDKEEDEKILSEDVVRWGFEIPKNKNGRFGFRIVYRVLDKNGKCVKGSKDKTRKYKVDKNGNFEYKMKYLFWGKLDLEDLDDVFVESTSIVKNWDKIADRERLTAPTLKELKEKIKNYPNSTEQAIEEERIKQNSNLHSSIQKTLHDKKIMDVLKDEKKLNNLHREKIKTSDIANRKELWRLKKQTSALIDLLKKCLDQSSYEQLLIIEQKYADRENHIEKIKKDFKIKDNNFDKAFETLEEYLKKIEAIEPLKIKEIKYNKTIGGLEDGTKENISKVDSKPLNYILFKPSKDSFNFDLTDNIANYFKETELKKSSEEEQKLYQTKVIKEPNSVTIKIDGKAQLTNIPFNLQYDSSNKNFIIDNRGNFEFNYATIHEGSEDKGHYFSIYKENKDWYIYDPTKDLSETQALKIDINEVKRHIKNAKTLVYEKKSINSSDENSSDEEKSS